MKKTKTPLVKALELAIKDLRWVCQDHYTYNASADRWGFEFAKRARAKYNEHQDAIRIIQSMLDKIIERGD